jgi:predicted ATPase with chaperone activity
VKPLKKKRTPGHARNLATEILEAREFSKKNFGSLTSELSPQWLDENLPDSSFEKLLSDVNSLRSRHKILRVARTIQALERSTSLKPEHLFEAKWYRFDPNLSIAN